jgi:hypothetical protein
MIIEKPGAFLAKLPWLTVMCGIDLGSQVDLGRQIWIGWRARPWTGWWTQSTGPRWTRANGDNPDLIWGVGFAMDGWGGPWATGGGARWWVGGARRRLTRDLAGVARNRARWLGLQSGWAQNEEWKETNPTTGSWRWLERRRGRRGGRGGRLNSSEQRWVCRLGVCETKGKMRFLTLLRCSGWSERRRGGSGGGDRRRRPEVEDGGGKLRFDDGGRSWDKRKLGWALSAKKREEEMIRDTPPTARSSDGQQWRGGRSL